MLGVAFTEKSQPATVEPRSSWVHGPVRHSSDLLCGRGEGSGRPKLCPRGCSTQHPFKGKGKRPRYPEGALRPSFQTARADQKYYDDLDAGIPEPEAFRRHKNRFRALMHAFRTGKAVPPTPRGRRSDGQLPPIQLQGRWHRETLLRRLRRLEARGVYPTAEENNQAINLEQLINYLEENYPPGAQRSGTFRPLQERTLGRSRKEEDPPRRRGRQSSLQQLLARPIQKGHIPQSTQWLHQPHRWMTRWRLTQPLSRPLRRAQMRRWSWSLAWSPITNPWIMTSRLRV